jgi:hypothetical protein
LYVPCACHDGKMDVTFRAMELRYTIPKLNCDG